MLAPYSDQPGTARGPLGRLSYAGPDPGADVGHEAAALLAWARRLAAAEVEVQTVGQQVRAAAADVATADPIGEAFTELARRTAALVAVLAHRVGGAARLLAVESMRAAP